MQKTDPQQLGKLFQSEHPQTIAVVLAHLDSSTAADVLKHLPENVRGDIILRLANLQTVSQDVVKENLSRSQSKIDQRQRNEPHDRRRNSLRGGNLQPA